MQAVDRALEDVHKSWKLISEEYTSHALEREGKNFPCMDDPINKATSFPPLVR